MDNDASSSCWIPADEWVCSSSRLVHTGSTALSLLVSLRSWPLSWLTFHSHSTHHMLGTNDMWYSCGIRNAYWSMFIVHAGGNPFHHQAWQQWYWSGPPHLLLPLTPMLEWPAGWWSFSSSHLTSAQTFIEIQGCLLGKTKAGLGFPPSISGQM